MCGFAGIIGEQDLSDRFIATVSGAIAHGSGPVYLNNKYQSLKWDATTGSALMGAVLSRENIKLLPLNQFSLQVHIFLIV